MKKTSLITIAILGAACLAGWVLVQAQESDLAAPSIQPLSLTPADISQLPTLSEKDLSGFLDSLSSITPLPPEDVPFIGNFYSLQHPDWPPLPVNVRVDSVWPISGFGSDSSYFLLSDLDENYNVRKKLNRDGDAMAMFSLDPGDPADGGDGDTNYFQPEFHPIILTTNDLWLQVISTTNTGTRITASLVIHPPWNMIGGVWDIFAATNVASSTWQWVFRSAPGQTNVTITGLAYPNEFFRAASTNDTDGDLLSDPFEKWVSHTSTSLYSTDGSGMSDGWEWQNFGSISNSSSGDPDGDGLTTYQEFQMRTANYNPTLWDSNTNGVGDGFEDYDGDKLANLMEGAFGCDLLSANPTWKADTDHDGLPDTYETLAGLNPNSAEAAPGLPAYSKNPIP